MKQKLSDLMDGEFDSAQGDAAWKSLSDDAELRDCWRTYHLIGDCLRGEAVTDAAVHSALADRIMARIADEPAILAPRRKLADGAVGGRTRVALALAASVATLSVVGIIASRQVAEPQAQVALQQKTARPDAQIVNSALTPNVNDYLILHRQFANPDAIQQANMVRDGKMHRQGAGR